MNSANLEKNHKSAHGAFLCRAARLVSLVVSMVMACILMAWAVSHGVNEGMGGIPPFLFGLTVFHFWLIPAMLAVIAWRYHFLGGAVTLLYLPVPFLITGFITLASEGHQDVSHLVLAASLLPVGATLHLVAWWKERPSKQTSSQHQPPDRTDPW